MGKAPPPIGPPTGAPEPLVDYIKLLREIIEEIAGVETELKDLVKRVGEKDAEIEKLEGELVSITGQIDEARTQLKECHDDCNRTREEIARVQKETLSQNLEIARLEGELRASVNRLNSLRNDRDQVTAQITELEKQMEEADVKMGTAHTPGWHYVPAYGWLWTSPEHYPLIFSNEREGWVYYERGTSDPWLYYDYNSEKWEQWFHDAPLFSSIN
jgi:septal ring factor EnvC (AmiA/AmiB activator)